MKVTFDGQVTSWRITWSQVCLALRLSDGELVCDYFGLSRHADLRRSMPNEELFGNTLVRGRSDLTLIGPPGSTSDQWQLESWSQPSPKSVEIRLHSVRMPIVAEILLSVGATSGVLRRSTRLTHRGDATSGDVSITSVPSIALVVPRVQRMRYLTGRWGAETNIVDIHPSAPLLLESRSGKSGFDYSPYLALLGDDFSCIIQLEWSGNWFLHSAPTWDGGVRISGGLNGWGLRHQLSPGTNLDLPAVLVSCQEGDLNRATQRLHDARRAAKSSPLPIPVQFNSWYPQPGEPHVEQMVGLAHRAANVGCQTFVLDAGWYTTTHEDPKEDWWTRTGDWVVNSRLFPSGLTELSHHVRALGMGFGIWFEPEAASPNSTISREHPDWLHDLSEHGLADDDRGVVNLGVPEARDVVRTRIMEVLEQTGARWMKWDMNTNLFQGGWSPSLPEARTRQDPLLAHYRGVYALQQEILAAVPDLVLEMCAGGGGRFDAGIMRHAHTNWMSDQSNAIENLSIHFGSQLAHPPEECNDWLIEWPPHDTGRPGISGDQRGGLTFRTMVAMLGSFGISAPLDRWSEDDLQRTRENIHWYKTYIAPMLTRSDQYMLTEQPPPDGESDWAAVWYADKDAAGGNLSVFRLGGSSSATFTAELHGLDPDATYEVITPDGSPAATKGNELSVRIDQPFSAQLVHIRRAD